MGKEVEILNDTEIDSHSGSTRMGCFIICVNVSATVTLYEAEDGSFYLDIAYKYSGSSSGKGKQHLPVSGNVSGKKPGGHNVVLSYAITNWTLTSDSISFDLTASISHTSKPKMGPDYIFKNQRFAGPLAKQIHAENLERFQKYVELHDKLTKGSGVSVEQIYQ